MPLTSRPRARFPVVARSPTRRRSPGRAAGPVAEAIAALDRAAPGLRVTTAAAGPGWHRPHDPAHVRACYQDEVDGPAHGHPDVAGALAAYRLAGALAHLVVGPLVREGGAGPVVVPAPDGLRHRRPDPGRPAGIAVTAATLVPGKDGDDLLVDAAAGVLLAHFAPVVTEVRAQAPYGMRGMWGNLADILAETAVQLSAEAPGADQEKAWHLADRLITNLASRQPLLRARPRLHHANAAAEGGLVVAKGTCCLVYKAHPTPPGTPPPPPRTLIATNACTTCPLRR
jgi:hypothetical protein